jgi:hypothetical protein
VKIQERHSYRYAEEILDKAFPAEKDEILGVLKSTSFINRAIPKVRKREGRVVARLTIDQIATNKELEKAFQKKGWIIKPKIISESESKLEADFKKGKIQVEVQFGNMARWYTDVFKFLLSYAADDIEVGVLVVPMHDTANKIDENVVYFERVIRELPHAKMGITIPIWVLGVTE